MKNDTMNFNKIRPLIIAMRNNGNRGVISKKFATEHGITEGFYQWYQKAIEDLFKTVCDYVRVKNSPHATTEEKNEALGKIYPQWKELLHTAEEDEYSRELHVTEHDISNLVGFAQTFVNDANDLSRGADKSFVAYKVWSTTTLRQFQQKVETDLGIRIAQIEVLSDEQRDFLRAERKILNAWRKAETRIQELSGSKTKLEAMLAKAKAAETKQMLEGEIKKISEVLESLKAKVADCEKKHSALLAGETEEDKPAEVQPESEAKVPAPKAKRTRAKKVAA